MAPWWTQLAVVVLCASMVPWEEAAKRFKTGLAIVPVRLPPNVQRCFKCHMIYYMNSREIIIDQRVKILNIRRSMWTQKNS